MPCWGDSGKREMYARRLITYAARVVALPISRYICLSIIAKDSAFPPVYNFWPDAKDQLIHEPAENNKVAPWSEGFASL